MTTTVKAPRTAAPKTSKAGPRAGRSTGSSGGGLVLARTSAPIEGLVLGGEPRVHLIPPAVLARKQGKSLRRRLGLAVVGVIVLVAVGLGLATLSTAASQNSLLAAQQQTTSILQEQAKYGIVTKVQADASAIKSSQKLVTAQEILWTPFYRNFQKTLPSDGAINNITANLDSPLSGTSTATSSSDSSNPLAPPTGAHVATVTGVVTMAQSEISNWLNTLTKLTGFVDATPTSVTVNSNGPGYAVAFTMHINSDALANRFTTNAGTNK